MRSTCHQPAKSTGGRTCRKEVGDSLLTERASGALKRSVRAGSILYDRRRDLARLIHLDPGAPISETMGASEAILARLRRALRAERVRGRAGHWTYDLNRHIALRQAYLAETEYASRIGKEPRGAVTEILSGVRPLAESHSPRQI